MWGFSPYLFPLMIIFITNFLLFWFWYTLVWFFMCYPCSSLILNQSAYNFHQVWKFLSLFKFKHFNAPHPPLTSHSEIPLTHTLIRFILSHRSLRFTFVPRHSALHNSLWIICSIYCNVIKFTDIFSYNVYLF